MTTRQSFEYVDEIVARFQLRGGQPGIGYGIITDGVLVHAGGLGRRETGPGPAVPPGPDTVFRIASMTKSFTAAAIMLLRDQGSLALDDPAARYVPELAGWTPVTPDAAAITIRHLLTMTAGFPTDDPWGDRQQGLPLEEFAKFLRNGVRASWAPGTRFEYSNLGYAILGRVITQASGVPYPEFVRDRLLVPLGMSRSGHYGPDDDDAGADLAGAGLAGTDLAGADRAVGYRRAPAGWQPVPYERCGAFAPMGGLFTSVRDLARWVSGLAAAFPPGAGDGGSAHPLAAASRREMQQPQVVTDWGQPAAFGAPAAVTGYGFGLYAETDPELGRIAGHGGGYPGFGSHMRWHPATGTGVIALANGTYAPMGTLAGQLLRAMITAPRPVRPASLAPRPAPWPETGLARNQVNQLLESWDDAAADRLFSPNVALDAPYLERRAQIELVRDRLGGLRPSARAPEYDTPARCRWWLAGEPDDTGRGAEAQVQIMLTPENPPRVQTLVIAVPPAPGSGLERAFTGVLAALNGSGPVPDTADTADRARIAALLAAASAWAGPYRGGAWAAGDGQATVTAELVPATGARARRPLLAVTVDPGTGQLTEVTLRN